MIFRFSSYISSLSSGGFSSIDPLSSFPPQSSHHWVGRFFTSDMILSRHISFPTGLGYSHFPRFSSSVSLIRLGGFSPSFHLSNTRFLRSTELASKKEGNCNVKVTRPTDHMISTHDHLHDLPTWSRHVTYELHPDIKASLIPISASSFPC